MQLSIQEISKKTEIAAWLDAHVVFQYLIFTWEYRNETPANTYTGCRNTDQGFQKVAMTHAFKC